MNLSQKYNSSYHSILPDKLSTEGVQQLSDQELLTLIINPKSMSGRAEKLMTEILKIFDCSDPIPSYEALSKIPSLGRARACQLTASFELLRRRIKPYGIPIRTAEDTLIHLKHYADRKQEHFFVISLNGAHEVIAVRCISIGLLDSAPVHPREVFAEPITDRAAAVIVAHNHPSGSLEISSADVAVTSTLAEAGKILGIRVLDHIIFSQRGHVSLMERGFLNGERKSDGIRPHRNEHTLGFQGDS